MDLTPLYPCIGEFLQEDFFKPRQAVHNAQNNVAGIQAPPLDIFFRFCIFTYIGKIENRPVLAILRKMAEIERELSHAQQEIERRKKAEQERDNLIAELQKALSEVKTLRGFLPICSHCKKIRDDKGYWNRIEAYIQDHSEAQFSHGICKECAAKYGSSGIFVLMGLKKVAHPYFACFFMRDLRKNLESPNGRVRGGFHLHLPPSIFRPRRRSDLHGVRVHDLSVAAIFSGRTRSPSLSGTPDRRGPLHSLVRRGRYT